MSLIVFSHGNSFPAATYSVLFKQLRARGYTVKAPDKYGHHPDYPVTSNWPHLIRQLHDFAQKEVDKAGEPAWLVGHSLGGFLSVLCAARHPALVRGVLLLDSPLLGGWKATAVNAAKRTQLVGSISPGRISRQRKNRWPDVEAAHEHFRHKKVFQRWDPQVLHDYVHLCTHDDADGTRVLSFDRDVETAIYNTLPHNMERVLRAHPLRCPAAFIGGLQSEEVAQVGLAMTRRVCAGRLAMLDGTHLFPMEKPGATAALVDGMLRALG